MVIVKITTLDEFKKKVLNEPATALVVVDFWATWCGPCLRIAPKYEEMAEEFTDVTFCKVDVDNNSDTSEDQQINCMPTFKLYKNGECIATLEGANEQVLRGKITDNK